MTPYYAGDLVTLHHGDCIEVMAGMNPESVDAIVTDPPYGLEFMGKEWDKLGTKRGRHVGKDRRTFGDTGHDYPASRNTATPSWAGQQLNPKCDACGRYQWGPTPEQAAARGRTHHKCMCDSPKFRARNLAPQMQAWHQQWAEAAYRVARPSAYLLAFGGTRTVHRMTCALEDAGWIIRDMLVWAYASGFPKSKASLKPAWEPIVMARKPGPLRELAIDACRIGVADDEPNIRTTPSIAKPGMFGVTGHEGTLQQGRWPANVVLTATEWYTLRDDIPRPIRDTIAEFYATQGMGGDHLPGMWQGFRGDAGMGSGRATEVLLPAMQLEGVTSGEADGRPAPPRVDSADEGRDDGAVLGAELASLEGRTLPRSERVRVGVAPDVDGPVAGTGLSNDDGQVRSGTSTGDGDDAGPPVAAVRGSASPQRREGRQRAGEPVSSGPVKPHAGAPDGGSRTGTAPRARSRAGGRERDVTVLLDLIPVGWRHYFRFSHDTGIFDGGIAGVVGGGDTSSGTLHPYTNASDADYRQFHSAQRDVERAGDSGTYSRFFLIPKAARSDREPVLGGLPLRAHGIHDDDNYRQPGERKANHTAPGPRANSHPTVKPVELMRHLVRLVTPTGGTVLDPFAGSGSTLLAAEQEGFPWIGIEREAEYVAIAQARLNGTQRGLGLPA